LSAEVKTPVTDPMAGPAGEGHAGGPGPTRSAPQGLSIFDRKALADRDYWLQRLRPWAAVSSSALLPRDRHRPLAGARHSLPCTFDPALSELLHRLTGGGQFLLYVSLVAALEVTLARYTGSSRVALASPARLRGDGEPRPANTLVIPHELRETVSFRELLMEVRANLLAAYEHQDYRFDRLMRDLGERPGSERPGTERPPLFEVVAELAGLHGELASPPPSLHLRFAEVDGRLGAVADFDSATFLPDSIERFLRTFAQVARACAADVNGEIRHLDLLPPAERQNLLVDWNDTTAPIPVSGGVHRRFEEQAARRGDAVAVSHGETILTYGELDRRADHLARRLTGLGVGVEDRVALCFEPTSDFVLAALAVLKAGGAYVPLDTAYPKERLRFLLEDSGAKVLLTRQGLLAELPEERPPALCLDALPPDHAEAEEPADRGLARENEDRRLAYVIYTSGSTGRPKGVEIEHRSLLGLCRWHGRTYGITPEDRASQVAGLAFDAAVWELWPYLVAGASLVFADVESRAVPARLVTWLITRGISLSFLPTPLAEQALGSPWPGGGRLRALLTGGDRLRRTPAAALPFRFVNHYGPTESTVVATCVPVDAGGGESGAPPIGRPIDNTRIYLLGAGGIVAGRLVPAGAVGEIAIGGDGLARGYQRQSRLTAARFTPDPFSARPGSRLYRSGDLGRFLPGGLLDFLGRTDHQVKVRGFRIELGEIEAVLARHPEVREAVVEPHTGGDGETRLVGYVVLAPGEGPEMGILRTALREELPEYMVPWVLLELPELPLTPNGKVDRAALPAPDEPTGDGARAHAAPRTPVEEMLAAIFADVLHLGRVGIHDSFFDLGGHSLLATQAMSRIREVFEVSLPLRTLFDHPVVADLAPRVEAARLGVEGASPAPALVPQARASASPLSFAQQRLWFLDRLEPGNPRYNLPVALSLRGRLDAAALDRAFQEILRRHEALRTTFVDGGGVDGGGEVGQLVHPLRPRPLPRIDLSHLGTAAAKGELARLVPRAAACPFDLARGPVIRGLLLRQAPEEHAVVCSMHHIASDGWSLGIFVREINALYAAFHQGLPSPLPELPVQYADFASWQRGWLSGEVLEAQTAAWKKRLEGAPVLELPTDRPRGRGLSSRGASEDLEVPPELAARLRALARQQGLTLFMVLLAAMKVLLHRHTGETDLTVGTPIANRNRREIEGLIGFFVNTLVLRTDLGGRPRVRELLAQVRERTLEAYTHQDLPFEKLVEVLAPRRDLAQNPLFQVLFILQNASRDRLELAGLEVEALELGLQVAKFDWTLTLVEDGERLFASLSYKSDLFDRTTIRRALGHFRNLLAALASTPEGRVADLACLSPTEQHQLRGEWNDTASTLLPDLPTGAAGEGPDLFELFAARAEAAPDSIALVSGEEHLSYRDLARASLHLGAVLEAAGAGAETLVAVCLERSPALVMALLGTLAAGAAYLPLDPEDPPERRALLVAEARPVVLLGAPAAPWLADPSWQEQGVAVLALPADGRLGDAGEALVPGARGRLAGAERVAYAIFTSGSTGRPKGVLNHHRGVVNRLLWMQRAYRLGDGDRVLQKTPATFDVSVWEFFWPLATGACLVLARPGGHRDPAYLLSTLRREKISTLHFVPSMLQIFLEAWPEDLPSGPATLPALRRIVASGEALSGELSARARERMGGDLFNLYGPTEAAIDVTHWTCRPGAPGAPVPIGRPIANLSILVLARDGSPSPVGVPGELHIGGRGLARGYLHQGARTAERFVPHPGPSAPGERLYRSGDLCRRLPDGTLAFLGRIDHQLKVRGVRIEPGEIEAVLAGHPGVQTAVVLPRPHPAGESRLVAYVVPAPPASASAEAGEGPEAGELLAWLAARLPAPMLPGAFVPLPELPLTASGKLDRRALPPPAWEGVGRAASRPPGDALELELLGLWEDVLGVRPRGIDDTFFDLGGHSFLAVRLVARIRERFGRELPLASFFLGATVARQAEHIRGEGRPGAGSPLVPIQPRGERPPFHCVHPVGGTVFCYLDLARELGEDQPFYGLQAVGLDDDREPLESIEAMAALYLEAILAVQPAGPYHLGGWSLGGLVAFAMSRELRRRGEEVALLALIDTPLPAALLTGAASAGRKKQGGKKQGSKKEELARFARDLAGLAGAADGRAEGLLRAFARPSLKREDPLLRLHRLAVEAGVLPPEIGPAELRRHFAVYTANRQAAGTYRPEPGDVPILHLRAAEAVAEAVPEELFDWSRLAPRVETRTIPGNHYTMIHPPGLALLCEPLRERLGQAVPPAGPIRAADPS